MDISNLLAYARAIAATYDTTIADSRSAYDLTPAILLDTVYFAHYYHNKMHGKMNLLFKLVKLCQSSPWFAIYAN